MGKYHNFAELKVNVAVVEKESRIAQTVLGW